MASLAISASLVLLNPCWWAKFAAACISLVRTLVFIGSCIISAKVSSLTGTVGDHTAFVNLAASPLSALHQSAIRRLREFRKIRVDNRSHLLDAEVSQWTD